MKLADTISGALVVIFGIGVVAHARTFPPMPGQPVGPSLFPTIIGAGLIVFGALVALTAARTPSSQRVEVHEWMRRPRLVLDFALVIGAVVFYAAAVDVLGFFITAFIFLTVLLIAFDVRRTWIVPIAATATVLVHYGFYTLLRVPLPWGLLGGIAW